MNEKEALLLGIILGDGCIGKYGKYQYKIQVTGHSIDDKEFLLKLVKPILIELFKKDVGVNHRKKCKAIDLYIYSKEVFGIMTKEWGIPAKRKNGVFIDGKFLKDANLMKKIIAGFFATDGSLVITNNNGTFYPRVEFQNTSVKILRQIRRFLATSDLKGGLYKGYRKGYDGTIYRLQYNGKKNLLKFGKEIGFINPKHDLKFDEYKIEMLG